MCVCEECVTSSPVRVCPCALEAVRSPLLCVSVLAAHTESHGGGGGGGEELGAVVKTAQHDPRVKPFAEATLGKYITRGKKKQRVGGGGVCVHVTGFGRFHFHQSVRESNPSLGSCVKKKKNHR